MINFHVKRYIENQVCRFIEGEGVDEKRNEKRCSDVFRSKIDLLVASKKSVYCFCNYNHCSR